MTPAEIKSKIIASAQATIARLDAAAALPEFDGNTGVNPTTHPLFSAFKDLGLHMLTRSEISEWRAQCEAQIAAA